MSAELPQDLTLPEEVVEIAKRLTDAGFETWCVGGAIRDRLLGHADTDFDLATAATPEEVQRLFKHTVPVGVKFGTVGVLDPKLRGVDPGNIGELVAFLRTLDCP